MRDFSCVRSCAYPAGASGRDAPTANRDVPLFFALTSCKSYGWVLVYNSRQFVETGNELEALGGNGAVVVLHDGAIHFLGSDCEGDATIAAFEREQGFEERGGSACARRGASSWSRRRTPASVDSVGLLHLCEASARDEILENRIDADA